MSLNHRQAERYLEQSLDGPLPAAQQAWLQEHLRDCAACRAYAERAERFHSDLVRDMPALWPARRASRARLAQTLERIEARRRDPQHWFRTSGQIVLRLALLLVLGAAAFLHFRGGAVRDTATPEDAAFVDPAFPDAQMAAEALAVRFELDFNGLPGEEIELYVPVCDGVEFVPSASALFRKLNLGQPLPECSLQPSDTILIAPGASHQLLLVYRNASASPVQFRMEPTSRTALSDPFARALCGTRGDASEPGAAAPTCAMYEAPPRGIWAKFITLNAPLSAKPGAHVTVYARVHWTQDGP